MFYLSNNAHNNIINYFSSFRTVKIFGRFLNRNSLYSLYCFLNLIALKSTIFAIFSYNLMICDFSKKNLTQKISKMWSAGKKQRPDFDSAHKTTVEMISLIPWTRRSYFHIVRCRFYPRPVNSYFWLAQLILFQFGTTWNKIFA